MTIDELKKRVKIEYETILYVWYLENWILLFVVILFRLVKSHLNWKFNDLQKLRF